MAFQATLNMVNNVAKITLVGELDAAVAPEFRSRIEEAVAQKAQRVALIANDLEYMSSAGLRVLVFARQKMGANVDIYLVGAPNQILEPVRQSGLQRSLQVVETYDPAVIEKL
jgi:anti-anti-sigma factor